MMNKLIIGIVWSLLIFQNLFSQSNQSVSNLILSSYKNDLKWQQNQNLVNFAEQQQYSTPWIRDLDVQYGNRDALLIDNLFSLRLNSNNFREIGQYSKLQRAQNEVLKRESLELLKEMMYERYQLCLNFAEATKKKIYLDSLNLLTSMRMNLMIQNAGNDKKLNIVDIVKQAADKDQILLDSTINQQRWLEILHKIQLLGIDSNRISHRTEEWVTIEDIKKQIQSNSNANFNFLSNDKRDQQLVQLQMEKKLQLKRDKELNGFFQFGLRDYSNRETLEEKFFTRVGLTIPLGGLPNRRRNALDLEIFEIRDRIVLSDSIKTWNLKILAKQIDFQILQYQQLLNSEEYKICNRFLNSENLRREMSSDDLLYLYIHKLLAQLEILKLEMVIYDTYIKYLDEADVLISTPLRNHLTRQSVPLD
ncbi:MAG: hypothetical protein IPO62_14315 [Saprospiraceae bacterium]|nr:hypothetical protein [Saprospiraceae bacterium]